MSRSGRHQHITALSQYPTVELASLAQQVKQSSGPGDLPKIQGQPAGQ